MTANSPLSENSPRNCGMKTTFLPDLRVHYFVPYEYLRGIRARPDYFRYFDSLKASGITLENRNPRNLIHRFG